MKEVIVSLFVMVFSFAGGEELLIWNAIPEFPAELGVAGPFCGVHEETLLVAGGANFPQPVWENDKVWHRQIYALPLKGDRSWKMLGELPRPIGYGASLSVSEGVVCMGGNDADTVFDDVFLLKFDGTVKALPSLPEPSSNGSAALIGRIVYLAPGMSSSSLASASQSFLRLNLDDLDAGWEALPSVPAPGRAFSALVAQTKGDRACLYLIGGRLEESSGEVSFLSEVFEFDPKQKSDPWKKRASLPSPLAAGTGVALGEHHIFMLSGADGSLMSVADELKLDHPGFPKSIFTYDTNADSWSEAGKMPVNQVTTQAVAWKDSVFLVTGEVKPRVRTRLCWEIGLSPSASKKAN